jgi:hypothetical protein
MEGQIVEPRWPIANPFYKYSAHASVRGTSNERKGSLPCCSGSGAGRRITNEPCRFRRARGWWGPSLGPTAGFSQGAGYQVRVGWFDAQPLDWQRYLSPARPRWPWATGRLTADTPVRWASDTAGPALKSSRVPLAKVARALLALLLNDPGLQEAVIRELRRQA